MREAVAADMPKKPCRNSAGCADMLPTMDANDLDLLAAFVRDHSQDAFAALIQRHVNLVYSAALRQLGAPHLAEDVAQCVFTDLAQNAHRLQPDTILTAWLYQVTRRTAIDVVRREASRQSRERIATEMLDMNANTADWTQLAPILDEAMEALDATDRAAVLLRYFENKSLREVGQTLGTSDDTAQKRVSRAVDRLREFFSKRGVAVGASGLGLIMAANAVQAAPAGLAATILTGSALAGTTVAATTTATGKVVALATVKKALIATAVAAAVGTGLYGAREVLRARQPASARVSPSAASFAELADRDIPGVYKWTEDGKVSFILLKEDHTFINKDGFSYPNYRWQRLPDRLVIAWAKSASELTKFEAPGVYSRIRGNGTITRMEKQPGMIFPAASVSLEAIASILLGTGGETNGLTPVNTGTGDGRIYPGEAGGQECFNLVRKENRPEAYLYLRIGAQWKTAPLTNAIVIVDYFDAAPGNGTNGWLAIDYDSPKGAYTRAPQRVRLRGSMTWTQATFVLNDPVFQNRQNAAADFRLCAYNPDLSVREVKLVKNSTRPSVSANFGGNSP
jgi:RNA polymerase sigma factor (sigma-70 family)